MDRSRYSAAKALFLAARELPSEQRADFVAQECRGDAALVDEVLSLLGADQSDEGFLERLRTDLAPAEFSAPTRVGEFELVRRIGEGGMGVVYLAEQRRPRRTVALKLLGRRVGDSESRRRFEREIAALSLLSHPSIARIYSAGVHEHDGEQLPYYAMEYIEGRTLDAHLATRRLEAREKIELALQICEAVAYAHDCGVVHRDLKPSNVLVRPDGRAQLVDFGVARVATADSLHTRTGQVVGTLAYMSPEQADGGDVDARADVYAIGAMLYEMLTGRLPVETRAMLVHQAVQAIRDNEPTPVGDARGEFDRDLEYVLAAALAKNRNERYASAAAFASDLRALLEHRPVRARAPSRLRSTVKLVRRHRVLFGALAAVMVTLVAALVVSLTALSRTVKAEFTAAQRRDAVLRLADSKLREQALQRAAELFPAAPHLIEPLERWLVEVRALLARLPEHEVFLAQLMSESLDGPNTGDGELRSAWLLAEQSALVDGLRALTLPGGLVAEVEARLERARTITALTIDQHREAWRAAAERVAADSRFEGWRLEPQVGLVPLGPDPRSGLEEFALHGVTGPLPRRDPTTGELLRATDFGLVFVLIPGGTTAIGVQGADPAQPNFSRWSKFHPAPLELVELDPFLLSKFEMTKAQWRAATGAEPSYCAIGASINYVTTQPDHPVDSIDWFDASGVLAQLGLVLPTEAQWEHAARAGTQGAWYTGDEPSSLQGVANFEENWLSALPADFEPVCVRDGYLGMCPVGTFPPNPFGLHEVCGNVGEWCRDRFRVQRELYPTRAGDGLRLAPDSEPFRCQRGGNTVDHVGAAASYYRGNMPAHTRSPLSGVRPARALFERPAAEEIASHESLARRSSTQGAPRAGSPAQPTR